MQFRAYKYASATGKLFLGVAKPKHCLGKNLQPERGSKTSGLVMAQ